MGRQRWVVLNRYSVTKELLDKRGRLYISRPDFPVTQNILSGGNRIIIMQHGERWRGLRKVMHQLLTAKQVRSVLESLEPGSYSHFSRPIPTNYTKTLSLES